jgi:hypothetical protein
MDGFVRHHFPLHRTEGEWLRIMQGSLDINQPIVAPICFTRDAANMDSGAVFDFPSLELLRVHDVHPC